MLKKSEKKLEQTNNYHANFPLQEIKVDRVCSLENSQIEGRGSSLCFHHNIFATVAENDL